MGVCQRRCPRVNPPWPGVVGQYGSRTPASTAVLAIQINSSFRHLDLIRHMNKLNSLKT